jgi:hypothetical protein
VTSPTSDAARTLAASQEAVDIRRRLAQTRPDAFLPNLATSISLVSDVLGPFPSLDLAHVSRVPLAL